MSRASGLQAENSSWSEASPGLDREQSAQDVLADILGDFAGSSFGSARPPAPSPSPGEKT